jgi:hypothetical protein
MYENFHKLIARYKQFGGIKLVGAYLREELLPTVVAQGFSLATGRKSRDDAYAAIRWEANERLQRKYAVFIQKRKDFYEHQNLLQQHSNKIWVCWLQGFEDAPELVKVCVASMRRYLKGKEVTLLSSDNYKEYVELPPHVVERYERGQMPAALFSDLLRLEVLIRHGGTWMDATMLCTGENYPKEIMDCDLFMFQALRKDDPTFYGTSNWFITACSNNRPLLVLRDVLHQYWKDYHVTLNYYMFHDFFYAIALLYPEEIAAMPRKDRLLPLFLMQRVGDRYDARWMEELTKRCCFHKLNYRLNAAVENDTENFYHAIIKEYS